MNFVLLIVTAKPIGAQSQATSAHFDFGLKATYEVLENGTTRVTQNFSITNKSPEYFVEEYGLVVGSNQVDNVVVNNGKNKLDANVVTTTNQTSISFKFPSKNVGQNKKTEFSVSYTSPDIALVSGNALEVSIPKLANKELFKQYQVTLKTPLKFGGPTRSTPSVYNWTATGSQIITQFQNFGSQSIFVFYGYMQYYDLSLRYNLKNPTDSAGIIQIALPPDTQHQRLKYLDLNPQPKKIVLDPDGNWIADYALAAQEELIVQLTAQALVSLDPLPEIPISPVLKNHTQAQKFWQVDHPKIMSLAQEKQSVAALYEVVVNTLDYNYQKVGDKNVRLGAVEALADPTNSTCQEFTDLFIALARAKGVPARRLTGFAVTQNQILRPLSLVQDILHTWPEYYDSDKQTWIEVDPTWEKTTGGINYFNQFDLSHLVFAINGSSSETPYPAGSYKFKDTQTKDVEVKFGKDFVAATPSFDLHLQPLSTYSIPWLGHQQILITNKTGQAWYNLQVEVTSEKGVEIHQRKNNIDALLPFQTSKLEFSAADSASLWPRQTLITINLNGQETTHEIYTLHPSLELILNPLALISVGAIFISLTLIAGSILVLKRR